MAMQKSALGFMLAVAMVGLVASALATLSTSQKISSTGSIKAVGLGVYSDSACTQKLTTLSWGTLEPGETKTQKVYIKNEGNTQITLNMTTGNWNPATASSYITVSWTGEGNKLAAGASTSADITLKVSSSVTGFTNFTFDITISGSG
ncbi:MAG: hypothetical protein QW222_02520 [Candidatus Bathyarchaeia archaeon]